MKQNWSPLWFLKIALANCCLISIARPREALFFRFTLICLFLCKPFITYQAAYSLLTNGSFSLPETRSTARQMSVMSGDEKIDKRTFRTSKECSLSTSHFSVGEKVRSTFFFIFVFSLIFRSSPVLYWDNFLKIFIFVLTNFSDTYIYFKLKLNLFYFYLSEILR